MVFFAEGDRKIHWIKKPQSGFLYAKGLSEIIQREKRQGNWGIQSFFKKNATTEPNSIVVEDTYFQEIELISYMLNGCFYMFVEIQSFLYHMGVTPRDGE